MPSSLVATSKFLSLVLRHQPELVGLTLLPGGWVRVCDLLEAAEVHGKALSVQTLEEIVRTSDKQRFSFSPDGALIRANQGHSAAVDLDFVASIPPGMLFHGTATRFIDAIRAEGLHRMKRHHVHLSSVLETAARVGARHGTSIVLGIDAGAMSADGFLFYVSSNGVWLTDSVPSRYITIPA
jgi:putative RNA 2'-phosphotransferase